MPRIVLALLAGLALFGLLGVLSQYYQTLYRNECITTGSELGITIGDEKEVVFSKIQLLAMKRYVKLRGARSWELQREEYDWLKKPTAIAEIEDDSFHRFDRWAVYSDSETERLAELVFEDGQLVSHSGKNSLEIEDLIGSGYDIVYAHFTVLSSKEHLLLESHPAARLINEQKATVIVEHLSYDPIDDKHDSDIFTREKPREDFSKAFEAERHIYDYVFTDSKNERTFVEELDSSTEVVVYAKLPRSFLIPTPVGNYNPDWAIAFEEGKVKHVYFIAETKGSMSSMDLRKIEESKIECARKFFTKITSDQVKYDVVDSYGKLMQLVK